MPRSVRVCTLPAGAVPAPTKTIVPYRVHVRLKRLVTNMLRSSTYVRALDNSKSVEVKYDKAKQLKKAPESGNKEAKLIIRHGTVEKESFEKTKQAVNK